MCWSKFGHFFETYFNFIGINKRNRVCEKMNKLQAIKYYTVISWLRGEQSNYCPEVVEKIWKTVATCQRPKAEGNSFPDLLHYRGTMVWLFPK